MSSHVSSGDLEKEKLQLTPIQMMDRDYKDKLPAMQVEFIDTICLPVYTNLVKLSDNLQPMLHGKLIPLSQHFLTCSLRQAVNKIEKTGAKLLLM